MNALVRFGSGYPTSEHTGEAFNNLVDAINNQSQFGGNAGSLIVPGSGASQSGLATGPNLAQFGGLNRQLSIAGVSPGATAADNVIAVYSLPAKALLTIGQGLTITAKGSFAANGDNKTIKIIVGPATAVVGSTVGAGGTTIATTGVVATNGGGWTISADLYKSGASTQLSFSTAPLAAPGTAALVDTAVILIAVTANAATTASDVVMNLFEVLGKNI